MIANPAGDRPAIKNVHECSTGGHKFTFVMFSPAARLRRSACPGGRGILGCFMVLETGGGMMRSQNGSELALIRNLSAPVTTVLSGGARLTLPAIERPIHGGVARLSDVVIDEHIAYRQYSDSPLVHATLDQRGRTARGGRSPPRVAISFTPAAHERGGRAGPGQISGLEVQFLPEFIEAACEQRTAKAWRTVFDGADPKLSVTAAHLARRLDDPGAEPLVLDLLMLVLARRVGILYARADRRRDDGWLAPAALVRMADDLREDPARPRSLADMAQDAGLGVSAYVRAFRGSVGETPAQFVMRARLDHAERLLRSRDLPLSLVAAQSGLASASHLVRLFRQTRGVTPVAWRDAITKSA